MANTSGKIIERYAYDPWGVRRNPTNWAERDNRTSRLFSRGYPLQEHLNDFGLINMNGRVFDPIVARFLGPDKVVQSPDFTQSYNRYSYGFNNPLKYTDPSGWIGQNTSGGMGENNSGYNDTDIYNRPRYDPFTRMYIPPNERPGGATGYGYGNSETGTYQNNYKTYYNFNYTKTNNKNSTTYYYHF
ncbi:MAG TPA: RHS repeat-associated core domain-containing protein [Fermentimonas sp.]|nr:RHS repeat-associated core domain-containing protein [Fermentimonas sp.]